MLKSFYFLLCGFFALFFVSCGAHDLLDIFESSSSSGGNADIVSRTGWLAGDENLNNIPNDIHMGTSGLPASISLESKFPPIGNQGQYGTCVAWASGYNLKTSLNAIDKGWNSSDLSKTSNQTSPKDLWFSIGNSYKGDGCNGTSFEAALDALIAKGATTLSRAPYDMGECSGSSVGDVNNKLVNYRKIAYNNRVAEGTGSDGMTQENLKNYLAQGRPILIGARLGDRFMSWKGTASIGSDTYNNPEMQHAYHAMVLVGYDNSKSAFIVRNSWGTNWGNAGSIYVDYDFFLENFCFAAFVAQNPAPKVEDEIDNNKLLSGYDLLASYAEDWAEGTGRDRYFSYDVFNNGKNTILSSQKWRVFYMYYNAFNANEYAIIFEDRYTDELGTLGEGGNLPDASTNAIAGGFWNNVNVKPGKKAGEEEFGEDGFQIEYTMPNITGDYYLVVYADAYDAIKESNEDNNFFFITADKGKPLKFRNGIMQNSPMVAKANVLAKTAGKQPRAMATSVQELGGSLNAYSPAEIKTLVLNSKKSGALAKKIAEYRETNNGAAKKVKRR
jgi:hypothetical protein